MKKEMKIALVNPRVESYSGVLPPLGLLYLAACLEKENYQVAVFDLHPDNDRKLNELAAYQPDIVGIAPLFNREGRLGRHSRYYLSKTALEFLFVRFRGLLLKIWMKYHFPPGVYSTLKNI